MSGPCVHIFQLHMMIQDYCTYSCSCGYFVNSCTAIMLAFSSSDAMLFMPGFRFTVGRAALSETTWGYRS